MGNEFGGKTSTPNQLVDKAKRDYAQSNTDLNEQVSLFADTVAPYLKECASNALYQRNEDTLGSIEKYKFYRLCSCLVEDISDVPSYLNEKMEKLFTAIYPLGKPILYGVVSCSGQASIVIGAYKDDKTLISVISALLTGIELRDVTDSLAWRSAKEEEGGFLSAVPVTKVEDTKQYFDISTLMKSLRGRDYIVLFCAVPLPQDNIREKYAKVLSIRDVCASVSKRNVSLQQSVNDNQTETVSSTRKGILQEALTQVFQNKKLDFGALGNSIFNGGTESETISKATSIEAIAATSAFEMQNGIAMELVTFCDKAVERLQQGMNTGLWGITVTYSAESEAARQLVESCLTGEFAKPTLNLLPMKRFPYTTEAKEDSSRIYLPKNSADNRLLAPVTSAELGMICTPPSTAVPDFEIKHGKIYPMLSFDGSVTIGNVVMSATDEVDCNADGNTMFGLTEDDLKKHTFICGITGSGKTTTIKTILRNCDKPFLVIESAKKEYRNIGLNDGRHIDKVYTLGHPEYDCPKMNPFFVQPGVSLQTHIDFLKDLFNASFSFYGPMPYILEKCLQNVYRKHGWNLTLGVSSVSYQS